MDCNKLIINKNQQLTRNISKPGFVGKFSICTFAQVRSGLTGWCFEIPASAYCHPLSDIKRTFYSIVDGYITLRIPNVLIREELNETANFLVEFILERYYKRI